MKFAELKTMSKDDLEALLVEEKRRYLALRIALRSTGECKSSDIRKGGSTIARIKTYLNSLSS